MNRLGIWRIKSFGALLLALMAILALSTQVLAQDNEVDDEPGVLVVSVVSGGPAALGGLARGDIILAINGEEVDGTDKLVEALLNMEPGDVLKLQALHGDEVRELEVELGERDGRAFLGIQPYRETPAVEMPMMELHHPAEVITDVLSTGISEGAGVVIVAIDENGPAADAGLEAGDEIVGLDGEELSENDSLVERVAAYSPGDEVVVSVRRAGSSGEAELVTVILASHPDDESRAFLGIAYKPILMESMSDSTSGEELELPDEPTYRHHRYPFRGPRFFDGPHYYGHGYGRMPRQHGFRWEPGYDEDFAAPRRWHFRRWQSD